MATTIITAKPFKIYSKAKMKATELIKLQILSTRLRDSLITASQ
jgi:hypothetical protein